MKLIEDAKELEKLIGKKKKLEALPRQVKQVYKIYKLYRILAIIGVTFKLVEIAIKFVLHPEPPYKIPFKIWAPFDYQAITSSSRRLEQVPLYCR
jgi:hypothetical protein